MKPIDWLVITLITLFGSFLTVVFIYAVTPNVTPTPGDYLIATFIFAAAIAVGTTIGNLIGNWIIKMFP